jgi:hypothetical protein
VRLEGAVLVVTTAGFDARVRPYVLANANGCWLWQRYRSRKGYGQVWLPGRRGMQFTHRVVYEHLVGPIPDGLQIDHLCRVRACCRPDHLEPVTSGINTLRGATVNAENASRTHCPRGHELAGENLDPSDLRRGYRACATCMRLRNAENAAAVSAARQALGVTKRVYATRYGRSTLVAYEIVRRLDVGEPLDGVRDIAPGSGNHRPRTITVRPDPTRA